MVVGQRNGPGGAGTPRSPDQEEKLLIEKRIAQPNRDDQEALGDILEMIKRVERKTETLIEPELRDVLEPVVEKLLGALRSSLRY